MTIQFEKTPVRWDSTGAEPSETLKTSGFQAGQKPPAQIFNYIINNTSGCIDELQDQLTEVDDKAIKGIKGNGTTIPPSSAGVVNITASNIGAASSSTYNATLSTSWSGSGPYTQTVNVSGILASDNPIVDVVLSSTAETAKEQLEAWGCVSSITTNANSITATCLEEKPTTSIPIQLKVVR